MAKRKLTHVAMGKPKILRTDEEIDAENRQLTEAFEAWFMMIPGAEWQPNPERGLPFVYCRYYAVPNHPEWGKVFVALNIEDSESCQKTILPYDRMPIDMDHWMVMGIPIDSSREQLRTQFSTRFQQAPSQERKWIELAYHRCLGDLIHRGV